MLAYWLFCIFCKLEFRLRKTTLETQITYLYLRGKKNEKKKKTRLHHAHPKSLGRQSF